MASVQLMCARLGLVTGHGLAGVIRRRYPAWVLWSACALLLAANIVNIAADLGGMAEATRMLTHIPVTASVPLYGVLMMSSLMWSSYATIARTFKWLTLVLLAYVLAAFATPVDWSIALRSTLLPRATWSASFASALVAVLGTTISPYLFFWQAAQEVEEGHGRANKAALKTCRTDIVTGMLVSNAIMYFIILTTAATLHEQGRLSIHTAQEAAEALRPLAGSGAYWLFTIGLLGTGMLAVPVLAGSCAYAVAEAFAWRGSLDRSPKRAAKFYSVLGTAMVLGVTLTYAGFNPMTLLYAAAVLNGVLAPPLILIVILLTRDRSVMGDAANTPTLNVLGWIACVAMSAAVLGLILAK
jgi:Mn2+/Fe2+ NRAMP family transporter